MLGHPHVTMPPDPILPHQLVAANLAGLPQPEAVAEDEQRDAVRDRGTEVVKTKSIARRDSDDCGAAPRTSAMGSSAMGSDLGVRPHET